MIETVEDLELIDPALSSERLVYRLFHERGVRVFKSVPIVAQCSCSRDSVEAMLRSFSQDDRDHMVENGEISVTCEFCSANYQFAPDDVRPTRGRDGGIRRGKTIIMSSSAGRIAVVMAMVAASALAVGVRRTRQSCPAPLADASRLVLVTARNHERHRRDHAALRARIGQGGLARARRRGAGDDRQGRDGLVAVFRRLARRGEPLKVEGDKRAPAGIYPIGRSFGILASSRPNYLQVTPDTICVHDLSSPAYNTIASRARGSGPRSARKI